MPRKRDLSAIPPDERQYWRDQPIAPHAKPRKITPEARYSRAPPILIATPKRAWWHPIWPPNEAILPRIARIYTYIAISILAWVFLIVIL